MPFEDTFGSSGQDLLRQSLLEQYQPADEDPFTVEPRTLTDRLARKLSMRPTRDTNVDFNVAPEPEKPNKGPDLSRFGTPVQDEVPPEPSTADLSQFGTPVDPPAAEPPMTIRREAAAAFKGIPHGAISAVGGAIKGAGTILAGGLGRQAPEGNEFAVNPVPTDAGGNITTAEKAIAASPIVSAGQAVQDFGNNLAYPGMPGQPNIIDPMTAQEKDSIGGRIGTGAGAMAPYVLTTLLAGPLAGIGAAATGMATDTYGSVYEAAKTAGKTDDEAAATAAKSALVAGVLGGLPYGASHLGSVPGVVGKTLKPYLETLIGKIAASSATFATLGEAQEAILQQIAKDYDPKAGYTFDQKRLIAELILGAGMGGLHHAFRDRPKTKPEDIKPEEVQPDQPQPPGAEPGPPPEGALPGGGPQPGGGAGPNPNQSRTGGGAGPSPGEGPQPNARGPDPSQAPPPGAGPEPGKPPPGTGEGKGPDFTLDPKMRAKFEKLYRTFGGDPAGMADHELFNALNDQIRDTSATGHTAKPETPEEATVREATAAERTEREELISRGWNADWVRAMTPEQRQKALKTGRTKAGATASEESAQRTQRTEPKTPPPEASTSKGASNPDENLNTQRSERPQQDATKQPESATTSSPDKVVPASETDVATFTTSKGSTYRVHEDGTTTRNKAARSDPGHEGDHGPKERSAKTVYLDRDSTNGLSIPQDTRWRVIDHGDGTMSLATWNEQAKDWGIAPGARNLKISDKPAVGLHPVEVWKPEQIKGVTGYSGVHFGNAITEIGEAKQGDGTRKAPIDIKSAGDVEAAAKPASSEYTHAQGEANNRQLGHGKWNDLPIRIEVAKGGTRKMLNPKTGDGVDVTHAGAAYGYFPGTVGADKMAVDLYLGDHPESPNVYVIDEIDRDTGKFRQHKVMGGFTSERDAFSAYVQTSTKGPETVGAITSMPVPDLKAWLKGDTTKPLKPEAAGSDGTKPMDSAPAKQDVASKKAPRSGSEPQNLLQFLAAKGGLKPHPELVVMDAHRHLVDMHGFPPRRKLVKDDGMDLDRAREAAEEAGFLRGSDEGTTSIADFLDLIDDGIRGQHRYAEENVGHRTKREQVAADERDAHERERAQELMDVIERAGGAHTAPEIKARALELMKTTNRDAPEAIETAAMQVISGEKDLQATFNDIFGQEIGDEIHPQTASGDGESLAREGGAGDGSEEAATGEPRQHVESAGEHGGDRRDDVGSAELDAKGEQPDAGRGPARAGRKSRTQNPTDAERPDDGLTHSREIERAIDAIEEAVEAGDRAAVAAAASKAKKLLAEIPLAVKKGDAEYWRQFVPLIRNMTRPGYVTAKQQFDAEKKPESEKVEAPPAPVEKPVEPVAEKGADNKDQLVMPGAEKGADGKEQLVVPGAEKIGQGEEAQRAADKPLKPKAEQRPADEGLFGDSKDQGDFLAEPSDVFGLYSAVERAVDASKLTKAPGSQWFATIKNTPGVKPEEMKWLGLEDWLREQNGSVSKDQVQDYIAANKLQVKEITKTGDETNWPEHQLAGGENYRELLLTLPTQQAANKLKMAGKKVGKDYVNGHWGEPNVVAHVRMSDRTIDGKKTLLVDELQSDWHQRGRKFGYQGENPLALTEAERQELQRMWDMGSSVRDDPKMFDRYSDLQERYAVTYAAPPDAPFRTSWPELVMKRVIRYAAENGYAKVLWTPGAAQAKRYGRKSLRDGMQGFYDKMLPSVVNKLVGKYGAKVGRAVLKDIRQAVHSFDITPELRHAAVAQGFPLFQPEDQFGGKPPAKPPAAAPSVEPEIIPPSARGDGKQLGAIGQQWVLEGGRSTGNEHLIAFDDNGEEIGRNAGEAGEVRLPAGMFDILLDPNEHIISHHNHPKSSSFSFDDLAIGSLPGSGPGFVHGHDGSVYQVEVTPAAKALLPAQWEARKDEMRNLYNKIRDKIAIPMQKALSVGHMKASEGNLVLPHLVNVVLDRAGFTRYKSNVDEGDLRSRVPGLDKAMSEAAADIAGEINGRRHHLPNRTARVFRRPGGVGVIFDKNAIAARTVVNARLMDRGSGRNDREEKKSGTGESPDGGTGDGEHRSGIEGPDDDKKLSAPRDAFKPPAAGSTDHSYNDVLGRRLLGKLGDLNATEVRTQMQDKFARIKNTEQSVSAPSDHSAYQAESLYYGRTGQRLEALTEHHIDPIIREMKARDIDLNKLDEFLQAAHATERNHRIGTYYPTGHDFRDAMKDHDKVGGSGWSTNEAKKVFAALRAEGKFNDILTVAKMVWALNARTRRALFDGGLIDRDTFDAWNAAYKYYTPQRGHAEGAEFIPTGSGMNVRGKEAKTAFGRRSKADSPLAYSIMQAEHAIIRAEKNRVGNTFLKFVRANPDPERWTVDRPPLVKKIDPATGLVTSVPDNLYANRDEVFTTKVDGRDVHITLHGPDGLNMARALKNMGTANVHAVIRAYATITHTMAKLATSWNPEFMIPNLARDLGEAFINLQAQDQKKFAHSFVKHLWGGSMQGSMKALAGGGGNHPPGSPPRRYIDAFHEFDAAGGRIRFFGIDDPDQIEGNVSRKLKRLEGGVLNTLKDIGDKASKALEIGGGGIENATRLAAFMAAKDVGFSTADAAMLARNLTVDFNKKGELGGAIGSLFMFANAGIQGQARMVRALGNRRVWKAVGALAAAAALSTLYSILASDVDETGIPDYMKIPHWERDKNLIFMLPNHYTLKLPLPYGFAPFAVIGSHSVSVMMGHEKPGKAAHAIMDSILNAFNPLGEESSMWMQLVPSAMRPIGHIINNKNWTGTPLYPEPDKKRGVRPDSTQAFKNDSAFSKEAAKQLNAWSGGSAYKPGIIDWHPGSIDHSLQAITGGVGRFVKGIADSFYNNVIAGGEWQPEKTPILRRFIGKVGPEADNRLYYEKRQEALDEKANIAAARKDIKSGTNTDEAKQFLSEPANSKPEIFKNADAQVKALRARKDLTEPELRDRIRQIQNKARLQVKQLQPSQ